MVAPPAPTGPNRRERPIASSSQILPTSQDISFRILSRSLYGQIGAMQGIVGICGAFVRLSCPRFDRINKAEAATGSKPGGHQRTVRAGAAPAQKDVRRGRCREANGG